MDGINIATAVDFVTTHTGIYRIGQWPRHVAPDEIKFMRRRPAGINTDLMRRVMAKNLGVPGVEHQEKHSIKVVFDLGDKRRLVFSYSEHWLSVTLNDRGVA